MPFGSNFLEAVSTCLCTTCIGHKWPKISRDQLSEWNIGILQCLAAKLPCFPLFTLNAVFFCFVQEMIEYMYVKFAFGMLLNNFDGSV